MPCGSRSYKRKHKYAVHSPPPHAPRAQGKQQANIKSVRPTLWHNDAHSCFQQHTALPVQPLRLTPVPLAVLQLNRPPPVGAKKTTQGHLLLRDNNKKAGEVAEIVGQLRGFRPPSLTRVRAEHAASNPPWEGSQALDLNPKMMRFARCMQARFYTPARR